MAEVIDLRKKAPIPGTKADTRVSFPSRDILPAPAPVLLPVPDTSGPMFDLMWSAYEHNYRSRGRYWFLYPLIIAIAGFVFSLVTGNYLFAAFIGISFLLVMYHIKQVPHVLSYGITKQGVRMGEKIIDMGSISSFWIFTSQLETPELSLETKGLIHRYISIRLDTVAPERVREAMSRYVPEKEQQDTISNQITRLIGL